MAAMHILVRPNTQFDRIKIEITTNQEVPVIIWLCEPAGRFTNIVQWNLLIGTNITELQNLQESSYSIGLCNDDGIKLFEKPLIRTGIKKTARINEKFTRL